MEDLCGMREERGGAGPARSCRHGPGPLPHLPQRLPEEEELLPPFAKLLGLILQSQICWHRQHAACWPSIIANSLTLGIKFTARLPQKENKLSKNPGEATIMSDIKRRKRLSFLKR